MKQFHVAIATTLLALTLLYGSVHAQEADQPRFGVKGGLNLSSLYAKNADNSTLLVGYNVGIFGKFPISERFSLQPELYYTTKGAKVAYNNAFSNGAATFTLNYIELPVLLVVNVTDNFNIHVGPYVSYLVGGSIKNESNVTLFNYEQNISTEDYNKVDAGIAAGAAFDIGRFSIGARYNYGFIKVGKERSYLGTTYTLPDAVNGVLNFYVAISLL